jgi:hypothetical protein
MPPSLRFDCIRTGATGSKQSALKCAAQLLLRSECFGKHLNDMTLTASVAMTLPVLLVCPTAVRSAHEGAAATAVEIEVDICIHSTELALLQVHAIH